MLAPLADRLDRPDQPSAPLSSSHPLLRRILAGVDQLLHERRTLKEQARALASQVSELEQRLAEREDIVRQLQTRWTEVTQGADQLFWQLHTLVATPPAAECAMEWTGSASLQAPRLAQLVNGASNCIRLIDHFICRHWPGTLPTAAGAHRSRWTCG